MTISQMGARTNPHAPHEDGDCDYCNGQREKLIAPETRKARIRWAASGI